MATNGFEINEVNKLTFKVQAAGVIDASAGARWYESSLAFSPAIKDTSRILTQYPQIPIAANLATAQSNASANPTIIEDLSAASSAVRLSQVYAFNNSTFVSYVTHDTPASGFKQNWILPAAIPQANGSTSSGYNITVYSGNPASGGVEIAPTLGQGNSPEYVGWVWNYDQGLLFLSDNIQTIISGDSTTYPDQFDFYVTGFRYIGTTGGGGGDKYADCTTQDITQPVSGTLTLTISTGLSYTTGQSIQITSGANIILGTVSTYTTGSGVIDITVASSTGSSLGSATWCISLSGGSGQDIEIKGDTVSITAKVKDIDFVGAGVTTTGAGTDDENITVTIPGGGDSFTNATLTPQNFPSNANPNIPQGSSFAAQTFTEMMNAMLYPTLNPTLSNPFSTFTLTQEGFQEIGATLGSLNFNATLNRGSISPQYTSASPFRSGLPTDYDYTGTGLPATVASTSTSNAQTVSNYLVLSGAQSWTGSVDYSAGVQPKDSIGGDFDNPLPGSTAGPITRTISGVYPAFATTVTPGTLSPQSLQSMTTLLQVTMVAEVDLGPKQAISVPSVWSTFTGLKQFSPFTNSFEVVPNGLAAFTTTSETRTDPNGQSVTYTRLTHNGTTIGARQLQFTT